MKAHATTGSLPRTHSSVLCAIRQYDNLDVHFQISCEHIFIHFVFLMSRIIIWLTFKILKYHIWRKTAF
jgi:hypothetical protein